MRTFQLTLAYDGSDFRGWQRQPQLRTVQAALEEAWATITGEEVRVTVSSRTDAGVHALGQSVAVNSQSRLEIGVLQKAVNSQLPADVSIVRIREATPGFHATRDAVGKTYRYCIDNHRDRHDIFRRKYSWHIRTPLDRIAMQAAGQLLLGTHDFAAFQGAGSPRESTVRSLHRVDVNDSPTNCMLNVEIEGDGFLYNMVRIIVGTLVSVGKGKRQPEWISRVLESKDRTMAGETAPPQGLFLVRVEYADDKNPPEPSFPTS